MNDFIDKILEWPAIIQGILGSAIFAFGLWILNFTYVNITNSIKKIRIRRETDELTKFFIHEYYVNTKGLFYFTQGYLIIIYKVLKGMIESIIICVFWILTAQAIDSDLLINMLFGGIIIYKMIDLKGWFYPKLSKGDIENYDKEIVSLIRKNLLDERSQKIEINNKIKNTESSLGILSDELSELKSQLEGKQAD